MAWGGVYLDRNPAIPRFPAGDATAEQHGVDFSGGGHRGETKALLERVVKAKEATGVSSDPEGPREGWCPSHRVLVDEDDGHEELDPKHVPDITACGHAGASQGATTLRYKHQILGEDVPLVPKAHTRYRAGGGLAQCITD